ncbi:MAG: hypothetical protein MUF66_15230 [Gammaproteobacteria bacterium]|jgi:hypothetical protein|nr:hypothetical protein [Gammaproteobacteria bacterium]
MKHIRLSAALAAGVLAGAALAQPPVWEGTLKDGSRLQVDPLTRRPVVTTPLGTTTQLWDGVHHLRDGSTVTVRSGVIVPTRQMLEAPVAKPAPAEGPSACLVLVRKTCGLHDECRDQESCGHAQQLVQMEREEEVESRGSSLIVGQSLQTTRQCEQALADASFFKPCNRPQRGSVATPCERLVDRVCGRIGACDARPACGPAKQLLESEHEERSASLYPDALTPTSGQCSQALQDREFFLPCEGP